MDFAGMGRLEPLVLFEDESLVAVYKPARMHSAPGLGGGDLCAWTFARYPEALGAGAGLERGRARAEGGLLHRLDFETSGLVLFARSGEAFAALLDQQGRGAFQKDYLALSTTAWDEQPEGSRPRSGFPGAVEEALWTEARERRDLAAMGGLLGGRPGARLSCAFKSFGPRGSRVACLGEAPAAGDTSAVNPVYSSEILGSSPRRGASAPGSEDESLELRIRISRGFRHQIRAQLAWIGLPIRGDSLYGGREDSRLRLYAVALAFTHPRTGAAMKLSAEEP